MTMAGLGFDQFCDVYSANSTTGRFNVLERAGLACRLIHVDLRFATSTAARAEMMQIRDLLFDGSYRMPEQCQVVVDGVTYQPEAGSFEYLRDWNSVVDYGKCQAVRQQTSSF